jgi:hypothetical protein
MLRTIILPALNLDCSKMLDATFRFAPDCVKVNWFACWKQTIKPFKRFLNSEWPNCWAVCLVSFFFTLISFFYRASGDQQSKHNMLEILYTKYKRAEKQDVPQECWCKGLSASRHLVWLFFRVVSQLRNFTLVVHDSNLLYRKWFYSAAVAF